MTDVLAQTLRQLSIESGLMEDPDAVPVDALPRVIEEELLIAQEPGLADTISQADVAEDIAEQLDELADRADAVPAEDATVVALSAESMNREFDTIMRSQGFEFKSLSFENAGSDQDRLKGVAKDARAFAGHSRKAAADLMNLSQEGVVTRFLRTDKIRLHEAKVALDAEMAKLRARMGQLNENGVAFSHSGIAKFLTQNNKAVSNIKTAIDSDAKYLDKIESVVDTLGQRILQTQNAIKAGRMPDDFNEATILDVVDGLSTTEGQLMGNYTVTVKKSENGKVKIDRSVAKGKFSGVAAGYGAAGGLGVAMIAIGSFGAGALVAGAAGAAYGAANYKAVKNRETDTSKLYSSVSAGDLKSAVDIASSLERHVNFKFDWSHIEKNAEETRAALQAMEGEQKTAAYALLAKCDRCWAAIIKLADVAYEQAIYDIVNMASVLKAVGSHMKTDK